MDTGIGVEGYSIIGQGKISDIIDNKMDSRREIFEEAAGIVKYRSKKTEAERRLAGANANLDRVNDIIREIESRIGTLKTDSEKAAEFLEIREKYRKVEVNVILTNIRQAAEKSEAVNTEAAELDKAMNDVRIHRDEIDEKLRLQREASNKIEEEIDGLRNDLQVKMEEAHFITTRSQLNDERLEALGRDKIRLENELKTIEEKLARENANAEEVQNAGESVKEEMQKAKQFGKYLGIMFQIRDDIFDYFDSKEIGKPTGNDMTEGKLTLPVIYALNNTDYESMQTLAKKVKAGTINPDEIAVLVEFTKQTGGIEYAEQKMSEFGALCMKYIEGHVKDKAIRESLTAYVDYVIQRNY